MAARDNRLTVVFSEIDKNDIALVGGKGANLGEMASSRFPVPTGFIVTVNAYRRFLEENDFGGKLGELLSKVDANRPQDLQEASNKIEQLFKKGKLPEELSREIFKNYKKMGSMFKKPLVAVRSSATAEDLPNASFAGQQATYLNISGEANLIQAVRDCWASLFTPRAIFYRIEQKVGHDKVLIAVVVQVMVQSEVSGVAFTVDPVTNQKNVMVIEAVWGLGEMIVQGQVTPDHYRVDRESLEILEATTAPQEVELVRAGGENREKKVPSSRQNKRKLSDLKIQELAKILNNIHKHYFFPQDIEWAYTRGKFYIIQARPVTTLKSEIQNTKSETNKENFEFRNSNLVIILKGVSASPGIATGRVVKVKSGKELGKVKKGNILVTKMTSPDFVPVMRKVAGIVTDLGGQTSHAAIVSRELGIPCVVGTKSATAFLMDGAVVTVDGSKGVVYKGGIKVERKGIGYNRVQGTVEEEENSQLKTATKIYVNLSEPERAAEIAKKNVDGVGLLRAEFMMANIGTHPKKVIQDKKQDAYIGKLAEDLETFCKAFYPRPVVYRASDFKTNEYRNLLGGEAFEPEEPNPMLGFRGAYRYVKDPEVFELELAAIKKVRDAGSKNLWLMIPFVRSPKELIEVKKIVTVAGLTRGSTFKLWLMVELPVNVVLLPDFLKVGIDGVSIGSNDLTMLMLGTDRDNEEVAPVFDERSPAVSWALAHVIKTCNKMGVTSSICGQAPSTYDNLVEDLVAWGVTSMSINPDAVDRVRSVVHEAEKKKHE